MAELQMLLAMTNLPGSAAGPELCFYFSLTIIYQMKTTSHPRIIYMQVGFVKPNIFIYRTPQTAHQPNHTVITIFYFFIKKILCTMQQLLVRDTNFMRQSAGQLAYM